MTAKGSELKKGPYAASVRPATLRDLEELYRHIRRHGFESGQDGDLIFTPLAEPVLESYPEFRQMLGPRMSRPLEQPGWVRIFVAVATSGPAPGSIVGELKLVGGTLSSVLHRARLEMGIERAYRRNGAGSALIARALEWAREQRELDWVDLRVFGHNEPAQALYRKFNFVERSRLEDVFRVRGQSIEDRLMTLRLKK